MRSTRIWARVTLPALWVTLAGCCPDALYESTTRDPVVRLPLDESPHCFGGVEWWYYTGRLVTDDGAGYGIEAVIFHVPQWPIPFVADEWAAHFAVLDEARGAFTYEQVRVSKPLWPATSADPGFDLSTPLVQVRGSNGQDHVQAEMRDGPFALHIDLFDAQGPILHNGRGYVPYGANGRAFYYSRPRMQAAGTLEIDGQPHGVSGELWFDRQWGRDIVNPWKRWDWFSLRLDDGTRIMLYAFRDTDPLVAFGSYIPSAGPPQSLAPADFEIRPKAWWTSRHTGVTYPVSWDILIAPRNLTLSVSAAADDQELDARATTLNVYWEGLCAVDGAQGDQPIAGLAYVELTNYPRP